jgi:hypothetical protein
MQRLRKRRAPGRRLPAPRPLSAADAKKLGRRGPDFFLKDPYIQLSQIAGAIRHGVGLSSEQLQTLGGWLDEFLKSEGTKSLDDVIGLRPGRGQKPLGKKWSRFYRDQRLCSLMCSLVAEGWNVEEAAEAIAAIQDRLPRQPTRWKLPALEPRTLRDIYSTFQFRFLAEAFKQAVPSAHKSDLHLIHRFVPPHLIPPRLKSRVK